MKKSTVLLLLLVSANLCGLVLFCGGNAVESAWYFLFGGETFYSADYREVAFEGIAEGWNDTEVRRVLGQPVAIQKLEFENTWRYCPAASNGKPGEMTFDLFGPAASIAFDPSGVAIGVSGDYLCGVAAGMSKESIEARWGPPSSTVMQHAGYRYCYSRPGASGTYKVRAVVFNEDMIVTGKERCIYFD